MGTRNSISIKRLGTGHYRSKLSHGMIVGREVVVLSPEQVGLFLSGVSDFVLETLCIGL